MQSALGLNPAQQKKKYIKQKNITNELKSMSVSVCE